MANVYDRWHKSKPGAGDAECPEHKGKYPNAEHGVGKRWQIRYRDPSGEQRKENFARKADADARAVQLQGSINRGAYVDPSAGKERFRDVGERWRTSAVHSGATAERVDRALRLHIYPILGDLPIAAIRTSDLQTWVRDRAEHLAPSTLKVTYSYVTAVFRAAELDRSIAFNPCRGVKLPAARRRELVPLPIGVVAALIESAPRWYQAMLLLAAASGMRQGELFGLELKHIDLQNGVIRVEQQLISPDRGEPYIAPPKTHESYRTIPVAATALEALSAHLERFPARRIDIENRLDRRRPRRSKSQLVFTNEHGAAIRRASWSQVWETLERSTDKELARRYVKAVGSWERLGRPEGQEPVRQRVPDGATMHDLRHFYASVLIKHRESVKTVQRRLGHAKPSITLDIYTHLWPDEEDTTRAAIENAFAAVPPMCPPTSKG